MEEMAEQPAVIESPIPKLEPSLDDWEPGSEILNAEQNMILGTSCEAEETEGSDDSAMTID